MAGSYDQYLSAVRDTERLIGEIATRDVALATATIESTGDEAELVHLAAAISVREAYDATDQEEGLIRSSVLTVAGLADLNDAASLLATAELAEAGPQDPSATSMQSLQETYLGHDMQQMLDDMAAAASLPTLDPAVGVDLDGFESEIRAHAKEIVGTGAESVKRLIGAVTWRSVGKYIDNALDSIAAYQAARNAVRGARQLATRLIKSAIDKLRAAVGSERLDEFIERKRSDIEEWIADGGPGALLENLFGVDGVVSDCVDAARTNRADGVALAVAVAAAAGIAQHAASLASVGQGLIALVEIVQGVLAAFGVNLWMTPVAPFLAAGFVLAIAAVVWQVQDHLDSDVPFTMPNARTGLRTAVLAALG